MKTNCIASVYGTKRIAGVGCFLGNRTVLTCAHVVAAACGKALDSMKEPKDGVQVAFPFLSNQKFEGTICFWDAPHDIACLKLRGQLPARLEPVNFLQDQDWLSAGHTFEVFGFPEYFEMGQFARGRFGEQLPEGWIQVEGEKEQGYSIRPGYSGGPAWDADLQKMVGMVIAADADIKNKVGYVIPSNVLMGYGIPAKCVNNPPENDGNGITDGQASIPTGTVTFLFTDIQGSTPLWGSQPGAMKANSRQHNIILSKAIENHQGFLFKTVGDEFCATFHKAIDAVLAAVEAQNELLREDWGTADIRVRMGIHTGEVDLENQDYFGYALSRVARIMAAGHGGQILASGVTAELLHGTLPPEIILQDLRKCQLKGILAPEHIYQVNASELPSTFPPLKCGKPGNLPQNPKSFIGRRKELAAIKKLIAKNRIVTLTGPGGIGKTRLAVQVAAAVQEQYEDGAWLINLAPLAEPERIPQVFLSAFGIPDQKNRPPKDILSDFLRDQHTLIVLDNCEHLHKASADIVSTIRLAAQNVTIISTSRERLNVEGEQKYPVLPLSLPDIKIGFPFEKINSWDAVHLFVERAASVAPGFHLNVHNAMDVLQICSRLDGLPLAIELAAAQVETMSVKEILGELTRVFDFLSNGPQDAEPRQQTLLSLITWSYELLLADERTLLRRLAVFSDGWTVSAAKAVCADADQGEIDGQKVLKLLSRLVTQSIVLFVNQSRYRMLEIMRQFSLERLKESGETAIIQERLANYFLVYLRANRSNFDLLEQEWLNLIFAFDVFQNTEKPQKLFEFAELISDVLFERGHLIDSRKIFQTALETAKRQDLQQQMAYFEFLLGRNCFASDDFDTSVTHLSNSLVHNPLNDRLKAQAFYYLAFSHYKKSESGLAKRAILEARKIYRLLKDEIGFARALTLEGEYGLYDENLNKVMKNLQRALKIQSAKKDTFGHMRSLVALARIELEQGSRSKSESTNSNSLDIFDKLAKQHTEEALKISESIGDWYERPYILDTLAIIYFNQRDWERSKQYARQALKKFVTDEPSEDKAQVLLRLCWIEEEIEQGNGGKDYELALDYARQSLEMCKTLGDQRGLAYVLYELGMIFIKKGDFLSAREHLLRSEATLHNLDDKYMLDDVRRALKKLEEDNFEQD